MPTTTSRPTHALIETHTPLITLTLSDIFLHNTTASKAVTNALHAHQNWTDIQKAAFSTTIYDLVRFWKLLWYLQDQPPTCRQQDVSRLLTTYHLYKKTLATPTLPSSIHDRLAQANRTRALKESIPDWLDTLCSQELGTRWDSILHALNTPAPLTIRANSLKTTRPRLILTLKHHGIITKPIPWAPDALTIPKKINVFSLDSFQQGFFEVQDAASQMTSRLLDPKPGSRVLDACAGEGGKTLHLAALMHNTGRIIALDPSPRHLQELRRRATRAGADTIETRTLDSAKTIKRLTATMDRVLIDAPCSGLGTLRRNPDIKYTLTPDTLTRLRNLQHELLEAYTPMVKPSGRLVYTVCSILPSEGERQIAAYLPTHPAFTLLKEQRYNPDADNTDGFYLALLERTK